MNVDNADIEALVDEYSTLLAVEGLEGQLVTANHQRRLARLLATEADWTPRGAEHLVSLA